MLIPESIYAPSAVLQLQLDKTDKLNADLEVAIDNVVTALETTAALHPQKQDVLQASYGAWDLVADAYMKSCHVNDALTYRERALNTSRAALGLDYRNREYKTNHANALFAYAGMLALNNQPRPSVTNYVQARRLQAELLNEDAENQYLQSRLLNTDIELLATMTFYPEMQNELTPNEILSITKLESEVGTSTMLDFYLMVRGVAENNPELIQKALAELTFALEAEDPDNERVQLALILQRLAERSLETTFVSNLPSSLGIKSNSESCNARLIQWAQEELEGNSDTADAILEEANALGLKGMALGFYSDLLRSQRR